MGDTASPMKQHLPSLLDASASAARAARWNEAHDFALRAIEAQPDLAHGHFLAGVALTGLQQPHAAIGHLAHATALDPANVAYGVYHARALASATRLGEAAAELERTRRLAGDDPLVLDTIGEVYYRCGLLTQAMDAFREAVRLAPDNAGFRYNLATALAHHGDADGAEGEFEACIGLAPMHWRAHHSLAQLRRQTPSRNHIPRLQSLLPAAQGKPTASAYLHMALAKEHEDLGDHAAAFEHMRTGKAGPRRLTRYDSARDVRLFQALMDLFPGPLDPAPAGHGSNEPIFIFGMPRSGTTLVDRILSSHPQVQSAGELFNFPAALNDVVAQGAFNGVDDRPLRNLDLAGVDWVRLGEAYLSSTRPLTGQLPRFIDKLPHNFLYAGFIAHAFPNARLVLLRRNPLDTCLGNFRVLFGPESPWFDYSYDLLDTGRYYILFDRLMAHWKRVIPGRILEVGYEALVEDQEAVTRGLLDFCGLPWDGSCLRFEHNTTPVSTASAAQVRRPVYRDALQRWKHYEAHLGPLRELLSDAGIAVQ